MPGAFNVAELPTSPQAGSPKNPPPVDPVGNAPTPLLVSPSILSLTGRGEEAFRHGVI